MTRKLLYPILTSLMIVNTQIHAGDSIDYPEGYRMWTHVKTMILHKGHALEDPFLGIHHVYGNEKGVTGIKTGQFENGSVLVFDLLNFTTHDNASTEGERVLLGVMVKDSTRYATTGGWGFEGFKGDSRTQRLVNDGGNACFTCHTSQEENDFVFSRWRE